MCFLLFLLGSNTIASGDYDGDDDVDDAVDGGMV